ncbi:MAG: glycosyltransferase family 39 protein [Sphingomonadales bacterium]|nr:glycosyltransferase family 39 protein [Sphingomonadales bacterium]
MEQVLAAVAAQFPVAWRSGPARSRAWLLALVAASYLGIAFALRAINFDNPNVHIDEDFYLLVGNRMLHGAVPYVDIWDRKPLGLFALYAAMARLGGDGVAAYQVCAAISAGLTALVIHALARRIATPAGAWWAGIAYLPALAAFHCQGGQTPVFYNLPVTLALLLLTGHVEAIGRRPRDGLGAALGAMALLGLAIQIKYTVAFEGAALGLWLLARYHRLGLPRGTIAARAALFIAIAIAPTAGVTAWYAAHGHLAELVQSNFVSIFQRDQPFWPALGRLAKEALGLTPFALAIAADPRRLAPLGTGARALPLFWAIAAVTAFLLFGSWFDHYVGAILPPLCVLAAPMLVQHERLSRIGRLLIVAAAAGALFQTVHYRLVEGNRSEIERATGLIDNRLGGGSLFLFEAPPILYMTTGARLPTRFIFPTHLSSTVEARALGVDQLAEVGRIMASRPAVVMIADECHYGPKNLATWRAMADSLARRYVRYADVRIGHRRYGLYSRRYG